MKKNTFRTQYFSAMPGITSGVRDAKGRVINGEWRDAPSHKYPDSHCERTANERARDGFAASGTKYRVELVA